MKMYEQSPFIPVDADYSPAADRNKEPIFERISPWMNQVIAESGRDRLSLLEVATGTGQHAAYFASRNPLLKIQPTDLQGERARGVKAWARAFKVTDQVSPLKPLNVTEAEAWPKESFDIIYCANMIHISPWSATMALFRQAPLHLHPHGVLITYGPYRFQAPLAPSNMSFDMSLKSRCSEWGIRSVDQLDQLALSAKLTRVETIACPANNHLLVFKRSC